ncbi:MAG: hypothetical protein C4331_17730 [Meiothermus sp.]
MRTAEFELLEVLSQPICLIYALTAWAVWVYLLGGFEDGINDPEIRRHWRARSRRCLRHWRKVCRLDTVALSALILLQDLLESRPSASGQA